jgi:2-oxoglutarate dehydrogenase E2 component (dihydrolipoamide succinyltransferase)
MPITVTMPQMGESVVEGTLEHWLVQKGDWVEKDQNLCEITTDKVDVELPAPAAGRVIDVLVAQGQTVKVGTSLAVIDETAARATATAAAPQEQERAEKPREKPAESAAALLPSEPPRPRATPVAARIAEERGIDLGAVAGTGRSGRIVRADVEAASPQPAAQAPAEPAAAVPGGTPPPGTVAELLWNLKVPTYAIKPGDQVTPFSPVRRRIAEHMVVSKIVSPHVGAVAETDLARLEQLRARAKEAFKHEHGFALTYLPFALQAAVRALREFPRMNATVVGQQIVEHREIHVGVAVETERGLLVPVIRNADRLSLVGLALAIDELARRAREREIGADDLAGGTFTLSNPGRQGNLYGFAVINQPQVGILRLGEVRKRPVVIEQDGEDLIAVHPVMYLALSYDHRVIDGVTGNGFLHAVAQHLQSGDFDV